MSDATEPGPVLVERQDHVMVITLNRPQALNAINLATHVAVGQALEEAEGDRAIWAVILTGAGDRAFSAGADLKAVARGEQLAPSDPVQRGWGFAGYCSHPISKPTIVAVNGLALGGGTEILLASDLAVASETASFGLPEVKRGIYAAAGGAFRITAQLPRKIAMEMLLTGEPISAARALALGLVNQVVPQTQVLQAALALAQRITVNAPLGVQASKRIALGMVGGEIKAEVEQWLLSREEGKMLMQSDDAREGPRAFAEKRVPQWKGH